MRLGIFGGTFDPPHVGHLILAAEARDQLRLDRVLWVLTPDPPHKINRTISPVATRLELVRLALNGDPGYEISRVEIDRSGPHFTVDTVRLLRTHYPQADLIYLMGGDSLHDLPTWKDPAGIVAGLDGIGVMRRPQDFVDLPALERAIPGMVAKLHFINVPLIEISSSDIRVRAAQGHHFRYYLPPCVYDFIQDHNLYRS